MRSIAVSRRWTGQSSPGCPNPLVTEDRRAAEPPLPRRAARSQSRASMGMGRPAADSFKEVLRHAPSSTRRLPLAREPRARKGPRRLAQRVPHRGLPRQRLQGAVATRPARRLKAFVLSAKKCAKTTQTSGFAPVGRSRPVGNRSPWPSQRQPRREGAVPIGRQALVQRTTKESSPFRGCPRAFRESCGVSSRARRDRPGVGAGRRPGTYSGATLPFGERARDRGGSADAQTPGSTAERRRRIWALGRSALRARSRGGINYGWKDLRRQQGFVLQDRVPWVT